MSAVRSLPRAALIGISGYGRIYLQLAREAARRGELALVAAVVINPEEEAAAVAELRQMGCVIYADYQEMLARHRGELELCLIPTGIHWHTRMTLAALAAGANVLVEKPLAGSLAEVESVRAAARAAGRFVAVGFQDYHEPATHWLKQELIRGAIGPVRSVRFLGQWPRARSYFARNNWAGRLAVDGVPVLDSPLNNAFAHFVNLSLFFASPRPDESAAVELESAELFRAHAIESFDTAVVRARTPEGVAVWLGVTHTCRATREPEIIITGDSGSIVWRHEQAAVLTDAHGEVLRREMSDSFVARHAMMDAVLRRLTDPAAQICSPDIAGRHTALIEAVQRAGAVVPVPAGILAWQGEAAAAVPVVAGLELALDRAYAAGSTLAAAGFSPGSASVAVS